MKNNLACIILAAGKGTRMKSALPKVMHPVAGLPMLSHVVKAAETLSPSHIIVVVAPDMEQLAKIAAPHHAAIQKEQRGTGDAVRAGQEVLQNFKGDVLVLYGDVPLLKAETLKRLVERRSASDNPSIVMLGFEAADPSGYGRMVVTGHDALEKIVEQKDANETEKQIRLCNSGVMLVDHQKLAGWLSRVPPSAATGEVYLTGIVRLARSDNENCAVVVTDEGEVMGVNSKIELAAAERAFQLQKRYEMMEKGVTLLDPETVYFAADTDIEADVVVHQHVVFGPHVTVKSGAEILPFSHIEGAVVESGARIGPFARLRPGAKIGEQARIGNFVEVKNADIQNGAKINHLSYVGDASIGRNSNIGAGTITCNYDGVNKYKTVIGDNVFVGSHSTLVAPVAVSDESFIAAGSVITDNVPSHALAIAREKQSVKENWVQKFKNRKKA